jgi:hypothetical protein
MTGTNAAGTQLYLYHNGGDTLTRGTFAVVLDGQTPRTDYTISDGSNNWSIGRNLILSITTPPKNIALIYTAAQGGSVVIRSASSNVSTLTANINPEAIPATPSSSGCSSGSGAGYIFNDAANISNSSYFVQAIQQNVTSNSISFWRSQISNGNSPSNGISCDGLCYNSNKVYYFTFTVNSTPSSISYGATNSMTTVTLNSGDVVNVTLDQGDVKYFNAFGIAPSIWELATNPVTFNITFANGTKFQSPSGTAITHTTVASYSNMTSTLVIDTWSNAPGYDTGLTVNGTQRINGLNTQDILLKNVRPVPVGLYLIFSEGSGNNLYFIGNANQITYNGIIQTLL